MKHIYGTKIKACLKCGQQAKMKPDGSLSPAEGCSGRAKNASANRLQLLAVKAEIKQLHAGAQP